VAEKAKLTFTQLRFLEVLSSATYALLSAGSWPIRLKRGILVSAELVLGGVTDIQGSQIRKQGSQWRAGKHGRTSGMGH
jgi:hypothetical protein